MMYNKHYTTNNKIVSTFLLCSLFFILCFKSAFAQDATGEGQENTASSAATNSVRDKVRQTIEDLVKKPKAVIGTLESVTDSTLKIKTGDGKPVLVAAKEATEYVKTAKDKVLGTKFEDLAIGDFVVAMGFKNGNDILDAKRVLAFDQPPFPKKQTIYGVVKKNEKGVLEIKNLNKNSAWTVETTKSTEVTQKIPTTTAPKDLPEIDIASIEEGDKIIVMGTLSTKKDNVLVAAKIHVVSKVSDNPKRTPKTEATPSSIPKRSPKPTASP